METAQRTASRDGRAGGQAVPAAGGRRHVLLLGGTGDARQVAVELADVAESAGIRVTTSLAGRTSSPLLPPGEVRVGGFGGPDGLADWLDRHRVDAVVDGTHPFAARITRSAAVACAARDVPLCVLHRPEWVRQAGDDWRPVASLEEAAAVLGRGGWRTALLTTGRSGLDAFAGLTTTHLVVRSVDPPDGPLPPHCDVVLGRGPFDVDEEMALMRERSVDVVVTKASGGSATAAKLVAARELGLPVVVVERPALPSGTSTVPGVADAVAWVRRVLRVG